eukprot:1145830-Pelagomonas_calceolata.AAC.2
MLPRGRVLPETHQTHTSFPLTLWTPEISWRYGSHFPGVEEICCMLRGVVDFLAQIPGELVPRFCGALSECGAGSVVGAFVRSMWQYVRLCLLKCIPGQAHYS